MNNTITLLPNGDFKVNPYKFDNDQILQDSVTPEAPTDTPQIPTITKVFEPPAFSVSYKDLFIGLDRSRKFSTLDDALAFIKFRAESPHLYNQFELEILQ